MTFNVTCLLAVGQKRFSLTTVSGVHGKWSEKEKKDALNTTPGYANAIGQRSGCLI